MTEDTSPGHQNKNGHLHDARFCYNSDMKQKEGISKIVTQLVILAAFVIIGVLYFIFIRTPHVSQTATSSAGLTVNQIKDAEYTLPGISGPFVFNASGEYATSTLQGKAGAGVSITTRATLIADQTALGDLNGDGSPDAVVPAVTQMGGSGSFYYLVAFLNENGQPKETAAVLLGDRIIVNSIKIENGEVIIAMMDHGPNDGMARATMPIVKYFTLANNNLTEIDPNEKTYTSAKLGITFSYYKNSNGQSVKVSESGDKISVNDQSVEVFSKDPADTLKEAIQKRFLAGYSPGDCFVAPLQVAPGANPPMPSNFVTAIIDYPPPTSPDKPFWYNSDKCPTNYSATNGISYFAMDENHPDRFMFFSIGQYFIDGNASGTPWQETIKVLPLTTPPS